ncbi:hypothetical protein HMPREF3156_01607 [Neisseria sp. HMSC06F02]|nr:hypothetical protein HMPREF3156_01607 [Neisseria sp. HMSC06F02]
MGLEGCILFFSFKVDSWVLEFFSWLLASQTDKHISDITSDNIVKFINFMMNPLIDFYFLINNFLIFYKLLLLSK